MGKEKTTSKLLSGAFNIAYVIGLWVVIEQSRDRGCEIRKLNSQELGFL